MCLLVLAVRTFIHRLFVKTSACRAKKNKITDHTAVLDEAALRGDIVPDNKSAGWPKARDSRRGGDGGSSEQSKEFHRDGRGFCRSWRAWNISWNGIPKQTATAGHPALIYTHRRRAKHPNPLPAQPSEIEQYPPQPSPPLWFPTPQVLRGPVTQRLIPLVPRPR